MPTLRLITTDKLAAPEDLGAWAVKGLLPASEEARAKGIASRVASIVREERKARPNQLAVAHAALFAAVAAFNTDRLPGLASEDDVLQIKQQLGTILLCAADLAEKAANEIDGSIPGSRLNPPVMAAILRDTINDDVLAPLDAAAELARIACLDAAE